MVKDQVHFMARTAQISKEKWQSIITLRHEGPSIRKMSRTLTVYSSAVAKTIKRYDETGSHEDRHRNRRPRVTSAMMKLALMRTTIGKEVTSAADYNFITVDCISDCSQ